MRRALAASLAVMMLVACVGCAADTALSPEESIEATSSSEANALTIAIAGMVTPKEGLKYYQGLAEYMGKAVGRKVRVIHKADYTQVNSMLKDGRVDIAFVCSGPYVDGHDSFGLRLLAAPVVNGDASYYSIIITPKSSDATSLASLRGKVFAFADPKSNTGFLVPSFMLADMGETPQSFFKETFFTYGHDMSIEHVATGRADGAAVDSLIWDYENATDPIHTSKTKIVSKSAPYATPPVVARPGLPDDLVLGIQRALLRAHEDPEGKALLDNMKIDRFTVVSDFDYDSIREMLERLEE